MRRRQVSKTQTTSLARRFTNVVSKKYFIPSLIPGCQLWLDASDSSSIIKTGTNVTGWKDKSGNGYHMDTLTPNATWTGSAVYPTIGTSINGLQTVNFTAQAGLKQATTLDGVKNLFWVGRIAPPVGSGANFYYLLGHDSLYEWTGQPYGGKFIDVGFSPSGITGASPTSLFTSDATAVTNATFSNVTMPSAPNVSLLSVAGITGSTRYQGICYDRDAHVGWCGDLAEVIIFSTALTTAQRQAVEGYLAHKWGLTKYYSPTFPLSISGCQLWLDAADSTTVTGTTNVTQWRDKSGNNRHFGVRVGGTTYSSNAINLNSSCMFVDSPVDLTKVTLFIVIKSTGGNNQTVFTTRSNTGTSYNSTDGFGFYMNGTTSMQFFGTYPASSSFAIDTSTPKLFSFQSSGTSISAWYNGISKVGSTLSSARTSTARGFGIGGEWTNENGGGYQNFYVNVSIYEIIVFNSDVKTSDRENIEKYLMQKWGLGIIPSTHPYVNFIPAPPSLFIPPLIAEGCVLWLDGADPAGTGVKPANGATISPWVDKATGKNGTASGTSTYITGGGVNFTGSSYFINQNFAHNLSRRSIFIVMQERRRIVVAGVFSILPNSTSATAFPGNDYSNPSGLSVETGGPMNFNGNYMNGGFYSSSLGNPTLLVKAIYNDNMNGTAGSGYLNGTNATNVTAGYTAETGVGYTVSGRWQGGSVSPGLNLDGIIYEILYFNKALSAVERTQVEGYLAHKWGLNTSLPSTHLYKSLNPSDLVSTNNFAPTLISGCGLWLDGNDTSSTSMSLTGSTLNTWKDKSGNGYNFTKAFSSSPTISNVATGTGPYFDANQGLYNTTIPFPKTYTIFSVANLTGLPPYHCYIMHSPYNADFIIFFGAYVRDFATFAGPAGSWNDTNANSPTSTIASTSTTASLLCCTNDGTTLTPYFNGTTLNTKVGTNATATGMFIGDTYVNPSGQHWRGAIAEFIVYNKVLTTTERQQVESYLAWKWGLQSTLPSDHTYKSAPPSV